LSRPNIESLEFNDPGKEAGRGIGHAETQLTNQGDVSSAHQFFKPGAEASLPGLKLTGVEGAGAGAQPSSGLESLLSQVGHGAEHALGAIAQPGGEPISPMIQMIMKMPGLTGIMHSFFEFMGALLHGSLMDALNPVHLMEHAGDAMASMQDGMQHLVENMQHAAEHVAGSIEMIPGQGPMLHFDGQNFMSLDSESAMHLHSEDLSSTLPVDKAAEGAANVGAPIEQPNLDKALFEKTPEPTATEITELHKNSLLDWHMPDNKISVGSDAAYRPTSALYQSNMQTPAPTTNAQPVSSGAAPQGDATAGATTPHHAAAGHHAEHAFGKHHLSHHTTEIAQAQPSDAPPATTDAPATGGEYTVVKGDSLWEIARKQLGDGSRWHEIYSLNSDVIGQNPNLINIGAELKLPGGTEVAGGDYVVQPGDNLWNIARHHAGGGSHWGQIYQMNHDVIGANPNLIHPGTHLALGGDGASSTVASAPDSAPPIHHGTVAHAAQSSAGAPPHSVGGDQGGEILGSQPPPGVSEQAAMAPQHVVADKTPLAANFPHSDAGAVRTETPMLDPTEAAPPSPSPTGAPPTVSQGTGEQVINSATKVPASDHNGLFYRKQN
jgi:LysM repeat protein